MGGGREGEEWEGVGGRREGVGGGGAPGRAHLHASFTIALSKHSLRLHVEVQLRRQAPAATPHLMLAPLQGLLHAGPPLLQAGPMAHLGGQGVGAPSPARLTQLQDGLAYVLWEAVADLPTRKVISLTGTQSDSGGRAFGVVIWGAKVGWGFSGKRYQRNVEWQSGLGRKRHQWTNIGRRGG